jgi:streptogramin lyase
VVATTLLFPQANAIQSIDFDSQQRVVYALTGPYDSSYAIRYKDENIEIWNLTEIFNLPFNWISTAVDRQDNIWAFLKNKLYKYDGTTWHEFNIPDLSIGYENYSDLAIDNEHIWLTIYSGSHGAYRFKLSDSTWTLFNSSNSGFPEYPLTGTIFLKEDSTFVGTNKGLVLIQNDSARVIIDTTNSTLETQKIYCFYIDSQGNKWLGTFDLGLVKWIDNSTFVIYNTSNSNLPDNFVNAIDEDSYGRLWLATDGGFACLESDSIISYSNLVDGSIATLAVDNLDRVWMGEVGTGKLYVFDSTNLIIITDIKDEQFDFIPQQYSLYQNYPNPFNPLTKISYAILQRSYVTLKVYDMLGKEVATLVKEEKPAGKYKVDWDATSLTSGVYFYRLQTRDFVETKKMVLMK